MKFRATVLAILVASVGGFLLWAYLKRFEVEASGGAKIGVLVTIKTLEPGAMLHNEDIGERWIPQAYVETRAIRLADRQRIANLRISAPLQAQQALMWTDIVLANDDKRDVSGLVQQGMRAVTIRAEGRASALVRPGDRVDVIGVFPQPGSTDHRTGVVLLQNVLVLGRDGDREGDKGKFGGNDASELALSLSLQHSQILAVAGDKGRLSVALRSPEDVRIQEGLIDISSTILAEAEKRAAAGRPRPAGPVRMDGVQK